MPLRHVLTTSVLTAIAFLATALVGTAAAEAQSFADTADASYGETVQVLAEEGVVQGCGNGDFCPSDTLTRAQFATVLVNALELPPVDADHFDDIAGNVHEDNINALADAGITRGCGGGGFCPDDRISRGEATSLLVRAFDPPGTDQHHFDDLDASVHADAINRAAAIGYTAGCTDPLTGFCPQDPVLRWQSAVFVARAMGLAELAELTPLEERREAQRELEEELARQEAEEQARLEAEREAEEQAERYQIWDELAQCESGGNWSINTGNGYYGGLQFALSSWRAVGGTGYPHHHSREEQIYRAERLLAIQGWGAWPHCSRVLGLR